MKRQKKDTNKDLWGKKQVFCISADPYKQEIVVVINGQFSDAVDFFKTLTSKAAKNNLEYISKTDGFDETVEMNTGCAQTWTTLPHGFVVILSHQDNWIDSVELVAHECLHLTHYVLRNAGITLTKESEEAYTYLQCDLIKKILSKMYA